jgi:purine-binding chemotaxis protein CheW
MQKTESKMAGEAGGALRKVLTFSLGAEVYGVDILRLKEIRGWSPVTRLPHTPGYLLGVLNLRGVVVPVIDLRLRFGLARRAADASTVVVVVRVRNERGERTAGIVVDAVSEVYSIAPDAVKPTPDLGVSAAGACVRGLATVADKMVMLLDIDDLVVSCIESDVSAPTAA